MKLSQFPSAIISIAAIVFLPLSAYADPKIKVGTVNMNELLSKFHLFQSAQAEAAVERQEIKKEELERIETINALTAEMKIQDAEVRDPSLAEAKRRASAEKMTANRATMMALQREREEFLQRRGKALNQKMMSIMNEIRRQVVEQVDAHAKDGTDVDYVFDSSGLTTAQVPFLLFAREKVDLTEDVLKLLNKDAPASEEAAEETKK